MKISLCMIVKNESGVLTNCLKSVAHLVDEIIITDTGSTDNTITEIKQYKTKTGENIRIEHFKWINDFSAARNYAFSKATSDYIMWLDADDILKPEDQAKLSTLISKLGSHDAYLMKYDYQQDSEGKSTCGLFRHRIVRNNIGIHWRYPIHECLIFPPGYKEITTDVVITHNRTAEMIAGDLGRNHELLQQIVDAGNADQRMRFYHATELTRVGKHQDSIRYFEEYFKIGSDWHENMVNGRLYMAYAHLALQQHDNAIEACIKGIQLDPRWAEFYCTIGQVYYDRADWENAYRWFKRATYCQRPQTWGTVVEDSYTWVPYDRLCMCAFNTGRLREAWEYNEKALTWHTEQRLLFNRAVISDQLFPGRIMERPICLNLGAGIRRVNGYRKVDVVQLPGIDEVFDQSRIPYNDSTINRIYSSHSLEHSASHYVAEATIAEWVRSLKPRGRITLQVPDLEACCKKFVENLTHREWYKYTIYGYQKSNYGEPDEAQHHHTGFTKDSLLDLAKKYGLYVTRLDEYDGRDTPSLHLEAFQATKKLRVSWVIPNINEDYPSFRIRVLNIHRKLCELGVDSQLLIKPDPQQLKQFDVVIFCDIIDPNTMGYLNRCGIPTVLDICEDIFTTHEHLKTASYIVCCSTVLADKLKPFARTICIPDAYEPFSGTIGRNINKTLKVICCCMDGNVTKLERLRPIIANLGMELVTITEGPHGTVKWDNKTWLQELNKADIVIVPQHEWEQPAKSNTRVTQAMALGLPVISSSLQSYKEIVEHGKTGFICECGEDWEKYLLLLRDNPELRIQVGAAAKNAVFNYSLDNISKQWINCLESLAHEANNPPSVDIIIPTWNNLDCLKLCIESIRACTDQPYKIIVVNQGTQATEWLNIEADASMRGDTPGEFVNIQLEKQTHFSICINMGVKAGKSPYIMLLNDDTIVSEGWLQALMAEVIKPNVGAVGPLSNCDKGWLHTRDIVIGGVDLVPAMNIQQVQHIIQDIYKYRHSKEVFDREWVAYYATIIPRAVWDDIGPLDEQFKSGCEDLDHGRKMVAKGYIIRQTYDSFIFHFGACSRKRLEDVNFALYHNEDVENHYLLDTRYSDSTIQIEQSRSKCAIIYTGAAWEPWAAPSVDQGGIGGSETMAAHAAKELARRGYKTMILGDPRHMAGVYDDVEYIQYDNLYNYTGNGDIDLFVTSRRADLDWSRIKAHKKLCWVHDIWLHNNPVANICPNDIDNYMTLSTWHKSFFIEHHSQNKQDLKSLLESKTVITHNIINHDRFKKNLHRDPYRFIYSSSPDRGLDILLSIWPRIMVQCPQANLHIYYGFENWQKSILASGNDQQVQWMNQIKQMLNQPGVYYHGRIGQEALADQFLQSSIWLYPTYFTETSCITAMEAMAAGLPVVTSKLAGLIDTVGDAGILLDGNPWDPTYQNTIISHCVELLSNKRLWQTYSNMGKEKAATYTVEHMIDGWLSLTT